MSERADTTQQPDRGRWAPLLLFGALPILAALGPLITVHGGLFAFRVACGFLIAHAVAFLLESDRWRRSDVWLAGACAWFTVAGLVGLGRVETGSDNPYAEFLAIMVGLWTALATRAWQRRVPGIFQALARGWVVAGLMSCGIAYLEWLTGHHLPGYLVEAAPDPAATFGNPNALAMFVVMANVWGIPVRRSGGPAWRVLTYLLAVASPAVLILTDARLAMVVWLMVFGYSIWCDVRGSHTGRAYLVAAALPAVVAAGGVAIVPALAGYASEAATAGTSGGVRQALTAQGLAFSVEQRGLPTWPGAFESLMGDHGDLVATAGLVNAHNTWVEMLVQYGVLSLVLVLGWMAACIASTSQSRGEAVVAVVAFLALGLVNSSSLDDASFWLFAATLAVFSRSPRHPVEQETRHLEPSMAPDNAREATGRRVDPGEGRPCT